MHLNVIKQHYISRAWELGELKFFFIHIYFIANQERIHSCCIELLKQQFYMHNFDILF